MGEIWNGLLSGLGSLLSFFYNVIPSYGVAIILLTISVRIILLPLTIKQTKSMQEMQRIQPMVKELQRKHKGNKQKLNQELMALYKEHQVNPLGGCLPLLLQLPVFFALYQVLTRG
ncbi:MAG: YidC/Oxa1 family membrane protein insertase, partial [Actinomycetota bacterium]